jgi:hypothetical protein
LPAINSTVTLIKIRRAGVEKLVADLMVGHMTARGYARLGDSALVRDRGTWREVVFIQLSSAPAQAICATAGVDVPMAREHTGTSTETISIAVGGRLSGRGINKGDMWLPVETREQVETAANRLAAACLQHEAWFDQFHDVLDVAEAYFRQSGLQPLGITNTGSRSSCSTTRACYLPRVAVPKPRNGWGKLSA